MQRPILEDNIVKKILNTLGEKYMYKINMNVLEGDQNIPSDFP